MSRSQIYQQTREVKFGIQIESDWPQMGQIRDFLRSVSVILARQGFQSWTQIGSDCQIAEPKCTEN